MKTIGLTQSDTGWAIQVLTKAFMDDPVYHYMFGNRLTEENLAKLQRMFFKMGLLYGQGFTTADKSGTIFILPPENAKVDAFKLLRAGLLRTAFSMNFSTLSRSLEYSKCTEKAIKRLNLPKHYHLINFSISPDKQGQGYGKQLMNHVLEIIDRDQLPVYLETSKKANLGLYRRFGFEVVAEDEIANSGVMNWGMLRPAAKQTV